MTESCGHAFQTHPKQNKREKSRKFEIRNLEVLRSNLRLKNNCNVNVINLELAFDMKKVAAESGLQNDILPVYKFCMSLKN